MRTNGLTANFVRIRISTARCPGIFGLTPLVPQRILIVYAGAVQQLFDGRACLLYSNQLAPFHHMYTSAFGGL